MALAVLMDPGFSSRSTQNSSYIQQNAVPARSRFVRRRERLQQHKQLSLSIKVESTK